MLKKSLLLLFFSLVLLILSAGSIDAQNQQKGVSVSPSIAHIDLSTDPAEYSLTYTNNFNTDIILTLSAKDFTELEDSYKISFLSDPQAQNYKYSLSSWISFENKTLELNPGETKSIKIFIDKNRITKGGHYASIMAEITQTAPTNKNISIKAVLSSLLFVRASTGKEIEEGKIASFEPLRDGIEYSDTFLLRFQNSGNVHVVPYGLLQIIDPLGNLVAKGIVNEESLDALPESIRSYKITTYTYQKVLIPGTYIAKLNLHYGKTNQKLQTSINFTTQGSFDFVKIGLFIGAFIVLMYFYRKRKKKYQQKI